MTKVQVSLAIENSSGRLDVWEKKLSLYVLRGVILDLRLDYAHHHQRTSNRQTCKRARQFSDIDASSVSGVANNVTAQAGRLS